MNIAMFSDNFYPELSGISDSIITLAGELAKKGYKIRFYVPKYSKNDYRKINAPYREVNLGRNISVVRIPSLPYPGPTQQTRLVFPTGALMKSIAEFNPDVIHTQHFFGAGLEALMAAKVLGVPIIGTNQTKVAEFFRYSPIKTKWFENTSLRYVSWYYNQCDFVTALSQQTLQEMKKFGFNKPHKVLPNQVDTKLFRAMKITKSTYEKKKLGLSGFTILYAGRLASEKHVDVIIKAISKVVKLNPNVCLALAGHGEASEHLKELTKKLRLDGKVKFLGTLDKKSFSRLSRLSDLFVVASTAETQCLALIQAMACSLPAIGVRAGALPEYIPKNTGFVVEANNPDAMAKKIIFFLKNPAKAKAFGRRAASFACRFSSEKIAQEWEKIYNEVLHKSNHGSKKH